LPARIDRARAAVVVVTHDEMKLEHFDHISHLRVEWLDRE
jgi:ABC-type lipoprotein export system ATPase subunit